MHFALHMCMIMTRLTSGIPTYRVKVAYIPQRPSLLPGTPLDFLNHIRTFSSREGSSEHVPSELAREWGLGAACWQQTWGTLSGGEAQRIALAIGVGLGGADVILLDGASQIH